MEEPTASLYNLSRDENTLIGTSQMRQVQCRANLRITAIPIREVDVLSHKNHKDSMVLSLEANSGIQEIHIPKEAWDDIRQAECKYPRRAAKKKNKTTTKALQKE